jgi:hypothetical protein
MRLIIAGKNSIAVDILEYAVKKLDISVFTSYNKSHILISKNSS